MARTHRAPVRNRRPLHGGSPAPKPAPEASKRPADHHFFLFEWNEKLAQTMKIDGVALQQLVRDLRSLARTLSILGMQGEAYIKTFKGKDYLVFKGRAVNRPAGWQGTRYLADNAQVRFMSVGVKGFAKAARETVVVGIVLYVAIDIGRAIFGDLDTMGKFSGTLGTDIAKCVAASATGFMAAAGLIAFGLISGVAAPMIVAVAVGAAAGAGLEYLDQKFKITQQLCDAIDREIEEARVGLTQMRRQVTTELSAFERAVRDFERFGWILELKEELTRRLAPSFPEFLIVPAEFKF